MMREQRFAVEREPQVLLRPATGAKFALKEKIVQVFEAFFVGDDPSVGREAFWDEVFLLKVNAAFVQHCFDVTSTEQLLALKDNLNKICAACIVYTGNDSAVRARNAMHTLGLVVRGVCGKKYGDAGFDTINLLTGLDNADKAFKELMGKLGAVLHSPSKPVLLQQAALRLIGTLLTSMDNINANPMVELMMRHNVFRLLVQTVVDVAPGAAALHACIMITLLVNHKKYEGLNPHLVQLSGVRNPTVMEAFAATLDAELDQCFGPLDRALPRPAMVNTDIMGALDSLTRSMNALFGASSSTQPYNDRNLLLRLTGTLWSIYELVRINRVFMLGFTKPMRLARGGSLTATDDTGAAAPIEEAGDKLNAPLMSTFLCVVSTVVYLTPKAPEHGQQLVLAMLTLQALAEDATVLADLFDRKQLHVVSLTYRHRLFYQPQDTNPRPFAAHLYDALALVIGVSLRSPLPADYLLVAVGVLHRLIVHQHRNKLRIAYGWPKLFETLGMLLEHVSSQLQNNAALLPLCAATTRVLHTALMHGDTFINLAVHYDNLIYVLLRREALMPKLRAAVVKLTASEPSPLSAALLADIDQFTDVQRYFIDQLEAARILNGSIGHTVEGVLQVIRNSLESLTLRQVDVDSYERLNEGPTHSMFFRLLLRTTVIEFRQVPSLQLTQP